MQEHFQGLHLAALEQKKLKPTPKQLDYFARLISHLPEDEVNRFTGGKSAQEMTGTEMRELIEQINLAHPADTQPASEKQLSWIASLTEGANLTEAEACAKVDAGSFADLTGGRNGTASKLIEALRSIASSTPREASEKQLKWIKSMVEKAELSEAEACQLVEAEGYAQLQGGAGGTASKLITILRKRTRGKKKTKSSDS